MENCENIRSILPRNGTSQEERMPRALDTNYFRLEERTTVDFINYIQQLSERIKYFNSANIEDGNWLIFFKKDAIALLVDIAKWDIRELLKKTDLSLLAILNDTEDKQIKLLELITTHKKTLDNKLLQVEELDDSIVIKENVKSTSYRALEILDYLIGTINAFDESAIDAFILGSNFKEKLNEYFGILTNWTLKTKENVDILLETFTDNSPHFSLLLTFLRLLKYPIEELNTFTERHLNFYHHDVLKLQRLKSSPDFVHLIVEPQKNAPTFEIPAGSFFPAGVDRNGINKLYKSIASQTINQSQIKKVYSEFLDGPKYKKQDCTPLHTLNKSFSFFDTSIAENIELGLIISDPVLFLNNGVRTIKFWKDNNTPINFSGFKAMLTGPDGWIELSNLKGNAILINEDEKAIVPYDPIKHADIKLNTPHPALLIIPDKSDELNFITTVSIEITVFHFKHFKLVTDNGAIDIDKAFKPFGEFPSNRNSFSIYSNELFMKKNNKIVVWTNMNVNIAPKNNEVDGNYNDSYSNHGLKFKDNTVNTWTFKNKLHKVDYQPLEKLETNAKNPCDTIVLNHSSYAGQSFLSRYITEAKKEGSTTLEQAPTIDNIFINYQVPKTNVTTNSFIKTAFGYTELSTYVYSKPKKNNIYIGLENCKKDNALSLLFEIESGTSNPLKTAAIVNPFYLNGNMWSPIANNVFIDETLGLQQSGIFGTKVPDFHTEKTTLLDPNLFWIKLEVSETDTICFCKSIYTQALKAILASADNSIPSFSEHIPPKTIKSLQETIPEVTKIIQMNDSFGGRKEETEPAFQLRISEHLRHKNRAISLWDIERIVLQEFPDIYRVKAMIHYKSTSQNNAYAAGYITVVCIAKATTNQNPILWKPMPSLDLIKKIETKIKSVASPHARIKVKGPILDSIQIQCKIRFREIIGQDNNLNIAKVKKLINKIIAPWAYEDSKIEFSGRIEISLLIQAIDNCDFVDFVKDFVVLHNNSIVNIIEPSTDFSLFAPNVAHLIEIV